MAFDLQTMTKRFITDQYFLLHSRTHDRIPNISINSNEPRLTNQRILKMNIHDYYSSFIKWEVFQVNTEKL